MVLLEAAERASPGDPVPFFPAAPVAGRGGVLGDEDGMARERHLAPVAGGFGRGEAPGDDVPGMAEDQAQAFRAELGLRAGRGGSAAGRPSAAGGRTRRRGFSSPASIA